MIELARIHTIGSPSQNDMIELARIHTIGSSSQDDMIELARIHTIGSPSQDDMIELARIHTIGSPSQDDMIELARILLDFPNAVRYLQQNNIELLLSMNRLEFEPRAFFEMMDVGNVLGIFPDRQSPQSDTSDEDN